MVWPELATSSRASSSMWSSTTVAKERSSRARSPGATARQPAKASCARSMAASVSSRLEDGTSAIACSVTGLMTTWVEPVETTPHILSKERNRSQSVTAASKAASSTSAMLV